MKIDLSNTNSIKDPPSLSHCRNRVRRYSLHSFGCWPTSQFGSPTWYPIYWTICPSLCTASRNLSQWLQRVENFKFLFRRPVAAKENLARSILKLLLLSSKDNNRYLSYQKISEIVFRFSGIFPKLPWNLQYSNQNFLQYSLKKNAHKFSKKRLFVSKLQFSGLSYNLKKKVSVYSFWDCFSLMGIQLPHLPVPSPLPQK